MQDRSSHYIPRRLDDQGKLLFWEIDQALIIITGFLIGLYSMNLAVMAVSIPLSVVAASRYGKLKAGHHPGMAKHVAYWYLGLPKTKVTPPSHFRELIG